MNYFYLKWNGLCVLEDLKKKKKRVLITAKEWIDVFSMNFEKKSLQTLFKDF